MLTFSKMLALIEWKRVLSEIPKDFLFIWQAYFVASRFFKIEKSTGFWETISEATQRSLPHTQSNEFEVEVSRATYLSFKWIIWIKNIKWMFIINWLNMVCLIIMTTWNNSFTKNQKVFSILSYSWSY